MKNKIAIIIQREYLTRVKKKSFIIMTILSPILMLALVFTPIWLGKFNNDEKKNIAVVDQTGNYGNAFQSNESYQFQIVGEADNVKRNKDFDALIVIAEDLIANPNAVTIYAENQVGLEFKTYIGNILNRFVEEQKIAQYNIPHLKEIIESSKSTIKIKTVKWSEDGSETETSSEIALAIGMLAAVLIYLFIFVYGAQVMRGVVEEKTNRIVEIIISSVKPFQLMVGKIIGIALVGLTQFFIWFILIALFFAVASNMMFAIPMNIPSEDLMSNHQITVNSMAMVWGNINFVTIAAFFILFFLGGYLLYASLFAAVGAASDNETDTQQFMLPILIPIIFALYAAINCLNNPDGPLAFWTSIIPLTSPIVMMVRIPLGVPAWELILSISLLFLSFIGTTWLAGKIYRTGILMYGKKITYKELWKWIRVK